jgi:hypothetical protein
VFWGAGFVIGSAQIISDARNYERCRSGYRAAGRMT